MEAGADPCRLPAGVGREPELGEILAKLKAKEVVQIWGCCLENEVLPWTSKPCFSGRGVTSELHVRKFFRLTTGVALVLIL